MACPTDVFWLLKGLIGAANDRSGTGKNPNAPYYSAYSAKFKGGSFPDGGDVEWLCSIGVTTEEQLKQLIGISPKITAISAYPSNVPGYPASEGWIRVSVTIVNGGSFKIIVDGATVITDGPYHGDYTLDYNVKVSPGTHNVCAELI